MFSSGRIRLDKQLNTWRQAWLLKKAVGYLWKALFRVHWVCFYNLRDVNPSFNLLSGAIPAELFKLQHIETLGLSFNNLSGTIPMVKGLQSIPSFNISNNFFSSELPDFGMVSNLTALIVYNNSFTGHKCLLEEANCKPDIQTYNPLLKCVVNRKRWSYFLIC